MVRGEVKIPPHTPNNLVRYMRVPLKYSRAVGNCISLTRPSKLRLVSTVLLIIVYVYATISSAMSKSSTFLGVIDDFGDLLKACTMVFIQYEMYANTKHLVRCFKKLGNGKFQISDGCSGFEFWIAKIVGLRIFLQILILILAGIPHCNDLTLTRTANYVLNSYIALFLYSPWLIVVSLLYFANCQLNIITSRLSVSQLFAVSKKGVSEYRNLVRKHSQLCWAIDDLSMWFQRSFLVYSAFFFYRSTFTLYDISKDFLTLAVHPRACVALNFAQNTLWQVVRSGDLWLIISSCQAAERNSMKFTSELHEAIKKAGDMSVEGILKVHFIVKPKVDFWANGFFKIDNTLIHSMIGAAATYLAVVYQTFDLNPPSLNATGKTTATT